MIDLHTHSTWSDGRFSPEQIVRAAIAAGLSHVAITDHYFTTKLASGRFYVGPDQASEYVAHIRELAIRYAAQISVLAGLEIDFSGRARIEPLLEGSDRLVDHLDLLLFEYVDDQTWYGYPLEKLLALRSEIDVPVGLAHNFLARNYAPIMPAKELVRTLEQYHIFVELNTGRSGVTTCPQTGERVPFYRYSDAYNAALWDALRHSRVLFSIGSDIHNSWADMARLRDAWNFLHERGLLDRLVTASIVAKEKDDI